MNAERQARQRALKAAKDRLQRRRKQREQLQALRQQKLQGVSLSKNDYGIKLVNDTKQLISSWKQSTSDQKQKTMQLNEVENKTTSNESEHTSVVPGARADLSFVDSVNLINIADHDLLRYAKETQTNSVEIAQTANLINQKTSLQEMNDILSTFIEPDLRAYPDILNRKRAILKKKTEEAAAASVDTKESFSESKTEETKTNEILLIMDDSKAKTLISNKEFINAFQSKVLYLDQVLGLNDEHPVFIEAYSTQHDTQANVQKEKLELTCVLSFEETNHRPITCLDFDQDGKRFLASYAGSQVWMDSTTSTSTSTNTNSNELPDNPDGVIFIFSMESLLKMKMKMKTATAATVATATPTPTPIVKLESQSMITNAKFHPTKKNIIVGSSVSGQVLGWDINVKKTPSIRTQFSKKSHSQPIFAMKFLPSTSKIQQILTVSNDGKVCLWRDDILHDPFNSFWIRLTKTETPIHMSSGGVSQAKEIPITCLSLNNTNNDDMWFGSDEGIIYGCTLNSKNIINNDSNEITVRRNFNSHFGPVTSVYFHPRLSIMLTSSFDWSCKLWHTSRDKPIAIFSQQDYIYDCAFSPTHCSLFACGDGSGILTLYDLDQSFDQPVISECIAKDIAITKIRFSPSGYHLIAGDSEGHIHVYNLPTSLVESSDTQYKNLNNLVDMFLNN